MEFACIAHTLLLIWKCIFHGKTFSAARTRSFTIQWIELETHASGFFLLLLFLLLEAKLSLQESWPSTRLPVLYSWLQFKSGFEWESL